MRLGQRFIVLLCCSLALAALAAGPAGAVPPPGVPANDLCENAIEIQCQSLTPGSTLGATADGTDFCGTDNTSPGVWYRFVGIGGVVTLSTCGQASFDTKISLFTGSCGNLTCVGGVDDTAGCFGLTTRFDFFSVLGTTYYILVHGFGNATGTFTLGVACEPAVPEGVTLLALNDILQTEGVDELVRVPDLGSGVGQLIGSLGDNFIESEAMAVSALADDFALVPPPAPNRIFVVDDGRLLEVDATTGNGSEIGPIGFDDVDGIAFHPFSHVLYGVTYSSNKLISIDINTGQGTLVAEDVIVGRRLEDIAFHPAGRAFILTSGPRIYEVDIQTGAKLGSWVLSGAESMESLLWSQDGGVLYSAADRNGTKDLVTVFLNPDGTGTVSFVSALGSGFEDIEALAWLGRRVERVLLTKNGGQEPPTDTDPAPRVATARLAQNVPNPFNPTTRIAFDLEVSEEVELSIIDVTGRKVASLVHGRLPAGPHTITWSGAGANGERLPSGVYRYELRGSDWSESRSLVILK